jgi:hypothetical protein
MKKLFLMMVLSVFTIGMNAQNKTTTDSKKTDKATVSTDVKYCCPKCDYCDTKAGKCPTHNIDLVKTGTYYCPTCGTTSAKACKCPKCGMDMKKMECKKTDPNKTKTDSK